MGVDSLSTGDFIAWKDRVVTRLGRHPDNIYVRQFINRTQVLLDVRYEGPYAPHVVSVYDALLRCWRMPVRQ